MLFERVTNAQPQSHIKAALIETQKQYNFIEDDMDENSKLYSAVTQRF